MKENGLDFGCSKFFVRHRDGNWSFVSDSRVLSGISTES